MGLGTLTPKGGATTTANPKKDFVEKAGARPGIIKPPVRRGFSLDEDKTDYVKVMLFGVSGSGKTHLLGQLAEIGQKVAIITTDIGDTGHLTIKNYFKAKGLSDAFKRVVIIPLDGYGEVTRFLARPWEHVISDDGRTLADFDPDHLAWDGFSSFQQLDLNEYVGDMQPAKDKDRGDYRESGLVLETQDWNAIKNATMRKANDYLAIRKPDGRPVNKWLTCHENLVQKAIDSSNLMAGTKYEESYKPMLQGAGGQLILGGFDLIARTKVTVKKSDDGAQRIYSIVTAGSQNLVAKNRGFDLAPEEPADMSKLWPKLANGPVKDLTAEQK